jgi:hypothetical protein
MANQDFERNRDPVRYERDMEGGRQYYGWMVGAALVMAVLIGVFAYSGKNDSQTANSGSPATSQTTGSGSAQ